MKAPRIRRRAGLSQGVRRFQIIEPIASSKALVGRGLVRRRGQKNVPRGGARWVDIQNALEHLRDKPEWKAINDRGVRVYDWQADDPLADIFLTQFGAYPSADEIGIDYRKLVSQAFETTEFALEPASPVPADILNHPANYLLIVSCS